MKKIFALLLAGTMALTTLAGCNAGGRTDSSTKNTASAVSMSSDWEYISNKGKMTIGITYFEPMNYIDKDGKLTGFETDFATAVCEELGITPDFQEIEWDAKEIELHAKTIDCIWNGVTITPERQENISFSVPYMRNKQVMVAKAENADKYKTDKDMKNVKVVAETGSAGEGTVQTEDFFKDTKFTPVDSQTKCLLEVKSGTSDVAVVDSIMALSAMREDSDYADLKVVENQEFAPQEYGVAFRKGSDTIQKVNEAIGKLYDDGKLVEIAQKYNLENQILAINAA